MAYTQKKKEMTLDELNSKYMQARPIDIADEFIDWIKTADEEEMQRVLLDEPSDKPKSITQGDIEWMQRARRIKDSITDASAIKSGTPNDDPEQAKMLRIKFAWGGISYNIEWTAKIENAMRARARDRKIEELLAEDEESFIDRCLDNGCIDDDM